MKRIIVPVFLALFLMSSSRAFAAPAASVRLLKKQNVVINFSDIAKMKSVSYEVRYTNMGKEEGAVGTIKPKKSTESRSIYLGTCSKKACTPHRNITNGTVEIKFKPKTGPIITKRYKLKF